MKEDPREPNVTAHPCPMDGRITADRGVNPRPTRIGAITATGTPNPPTHCKKEATTHPFSRDCIPFSLVKLGRIFPIDLID
ncbi:MAG: hypothetical protein P8046_05155, partial [Anaerolineales bacterium]